jgi:hypothetical protein
MAITRVPAIIRLRRGTLEQWQESNPILQEGEASYVIGMENDNKYNRMKVGDGITPWNLLPFIVADNSLPLGGNTGDLLIKTSNVNYESKWQKIIPPNGNVNEVLTKKTNNSYDTEWKMMVQVPPGGKKGQALVKLSADDYDIGWKNIVGSGSWDGAIDNWTETNNNLLEVLDAYTVQEAWEELHERINADELSNYHGLGLGDYLDFNMPVTDLMGGLATRNLRMYILGFNIYKGSQGNTKNHIVWGFRNCVSWGYYRAANPPTNQLSANLWIMEGGLVGKYLTNWLEGSFQTSLISTLGADYFYNVARLISTGQGTNPSSMVRSSKLWLPNEGEVFGAKFSSNDPQPQISIPLYIKSPQHRMKDATWWLGSVARNLQNNMYTGFNWVHEDGTSGYELNYPGGGGVAPCFCQI